jgi:hypothetical protein
MQVDLSSAVSVVSGLVTVGAGAYVALLRYAIGQKEHEIERRLGDLRNDLEAHEKDSASKHAALGGRITDEEKSTIRQDGVLNLSKQVHEGLTSELDELKRNLVLRPEWEARMSGLEKTVNTILSELRGARYPSSSSMPAGPKKPGA